MQTLSVQTRQGSRWQLGAVIPRLLAGVALVGVVLRFLPVDPLTFRAWEALTRDRPPGMAFEPNRRYYNAQASGDLAALGNLPRLRQYRTEQFTTDALGFRNPPSILTEEVSAILAGDSFAVGSGVSDDETLSAQLTALTGCVVYNAGSEAGRVTPDDILSVARRLNMRGRLAIRLVAELGDPPAIPTPQTLFVRALATRMTAGVRTLAGRLMGFVDVSPLQIVSTRAWKALENDRTLPNNYASRVVNATLATGDVMLFRASPEDHADHPPAVVLDYWRWLRDEFQQAQLDLLVVLVPSKYRVYRSFVVDPSPLRVPHASWEHLAEDLRAEGLSVLDLTPFLSAEAASALEHGEYLYWLDDVHWNARGIAAAATVIQEQWGVPASSCGPPALRQGGNLRGSGLRQ
jgi:acetyltransferase AlgX (SGNH hydrolase-like protein)